MTINKKVFVSPIFLLQDSLDCGRIIYWDPFVDSFQLFLCSKRMSVDPLFCQPLSPHFNVELPLNRDCRDNQEFSNT